MLRMRLKRVGRKNQPSFRVVVTDARRGPKSNRAVEEVGFYNPLTKERSLKGERIAHWLSVGAKPSDTVHNILVSEGLVKGEKRNVTAKKKGNESAEEPKGDEIPTPSEGESVGAEESAPAEATSSAEADDRPTPPNDDSEEVREEKKEESEANKEKNEDSEEKSA